MFETILFGIPLFWYAILVLSALVIISLEYESGWGASGSLGIFLIIMWLFGDLGNLFSLHGLTALATMIIAYFVLGTGWAVVKWYFYLLAARDWLQSHLDSKGKVDTYAPGFSTYFKGQDDIPPKVSKHKAQIMLWMTYWPWSALWTLTNDPVKRAAKFIYARIGGIMQSMSNKVFEGVK